jgi:hypothetical protein
MRRVHMVVLSGRSAQLLRSDATDAHGEVRRPQEDQTRMSALERPHKKRREVGQKSRSVRVQW